MRRSHRRSRFALVLLAAIVCLGRVAAAQESSGTSARVWTGSGPDAAMNVRPHGPLGWLYLLYMAVALAAFALVPLSAPWWCRFEPVGGSEAGAWKPRWLMRAARAIALGALFVVTFRYAYDSSVMRRVISDEYSMYLQYAELCADGIGCPTAGQSMGMLSVKLGPLFYVVLSCCRWITPDPEFFFSLVLAAHSAAAVLVAMLAARLYGFAWGVLAGLLFGFNPDLIFIYTELTHAPLVPLVLTGFAWGLVARLRGSTDRGLLLASLCLALATQLHGITLVFVPVLVALAWWPRPAPSTRAKWWALAIWIFLYAPWLAYNAALRFIDLRRIAPLLAAHHEALYMPGSGRIGLALSALGVGALLVTLVRFRRSPLEGRFALGLLIMFAIGVGLFWLGREKWYWRYAVFFFPFTPLVWAAGVRSLWWLVARRMPALLRPVLGAVVVFALLWLVWPQAVRFRQTTNQLTGMLAWPELRGVVAATEARGFRETDLEDHTHGLVWRFDIARPRWMTTKRGETRSRAADEHAVVVEACRHVSDSFASWQQFMAPLGRSLVVAGYRSELSPITGEIRVGETPLWAGTLALPLGDSHLDVFANELGAVYPAFQQTPLRNAFGKARYATEQAELRGQMQLAAGTNDRAIMFRHVDNIPLRVSIDGQPRMPDQTLVGDSGMVLDRYVVRAADRRQGNAIAFTVTLAPRQDAFLPFNVFEEPEPRCADPTNEPIGLQFPLIAPAPMNAGTPGP